MTKVDLFYFNAGGGHRAAALALQAVLAEERGDWTVELVDLFEVLDPRGQFARLTGMAPEAYYNLRLAKGWTLGLGQELKLLQGLIRLAHPRLLGLLQQYWLTSEPDLVVSVIPNFNRVLCESLGSALPGVPYVTVMTDLADYPPNFWIESDSRQHVICGTARAIEQAHALCCAPARLHAMSGMILRPEFYRPVDVDRRQALLALGLDPERPTGLVLFGGHGSMKMVSIARQLRDVQLILLCGHNAALLAKLQRVAGDADAGRVVVGFTPEVRRYMQLADFFIGKPGPGSMSEALHQGLPIVTVRNAWTMPQERYNTEWIVDGGFGLVGSSMRNIRPTVLELIARIDEFKERVGTLRNRAVFEVPDILQRILDGSEGDDVARRRRAIRATTPAACAATAAPS